MGEQLELKSEISSLISRHCLRDIKLNLFEFRINIWKKWIFSSYFSGLNARLWLNLKYWRIDISWKFKYLLMRLKAEMLSMRGMRRIFGFIFEYLSDNTVRRRLNRSISIYRKRIRNDWINRRGISGYWIS